MRGQTLEIVYVSTSPKEGKWVVVLPWIPLSTFSKEGQNSLSFKQIASLLSAREIGCPP